MASGTITAQPLTSNVGYVYDISDKLLGNGSFGDVYLATDENSNKVAVKCCRLDSTGIPNILEASIMATYRHASLNFALRIQVSDDIMYIIQDLAKHDMAQHTRREKGNVKPSPEVLKGWCLAIAQAVDVLHSNDIIHADIKASNILLYSDNSVRLGDFTLSVKKFSKTEKFTHSVCTVTHRPLECLAQQEWDESLDIWSLACTFYEIAYGELLFPSQAVLSNDRKDKDHKVKLRSRSVNAILDWAKRGPVPEVIVDVVPNNIDFITFELCEDFRKPEMAVFNDMLCKMLSIKSRINIKQVLQHEYFRGSSSVSYVTLNRPLNTIPCNEQARACHYFQRYSKDEKVQKLALHIYRKCNKLSTLSEHIRSAACTWIASKIVLGYPPKIALPPQQILSAEREVCHNLAFLLHA
jgi:cyclin-dependent kinase 2